MIKIWTKLALLVSIVIIVSFTSPWFYRIIKEEIVVGIILVVLSVILLLIISNKLTEKIVIWGYAIFISFTILFTYYNFDTHLFTANALDVHINKVRQSYYFNRFGPWIHNNQTLTFYKYQRNFFTNMNFNQFFFGGEPRFRPYALDFEKYSVFYLPFFLFGIFFLIKDGGRIGNNFAIFLVLVLLIIAFASPNLMLGLYPLYPIITALISLGIYKLIIIFLRGRRYDK